MHIRSLILFVGVGGFLACGGGGGNGGGGPNPTSVLAKKSTGSGDSQTGTVGQALANDFCAQVTQDGAGKAGVVVGWSTSSGGSMSVATSTTGADGSACSRLTLGTVAGGQSAQAAVSGATGSPVTFNATANAAGAATLQKSGGDGQSGDLNTQLADPLSATVVDQFGNGVSLAPVTWGVTSGTAALNPPSGNTNATGVHSTVVTLGGTAGPIVITASAAGLVGSPQTYNLTATTPAPLPTAITIQVLAVAAFSPQVDTVAAGGTVTWNWPANSLGHSVTSTGPTSFTSDPAGISDGPKTYGPITFATPGTYFYYCLAHGFPGNPPSGMSGTIVVQ